jgi:hypothetical protein
VEIIAILFPMFAIVMCHRVVRLDLQARQGRKGKVAVLVAQDQLDPQETQVQLVLLDSLVTRVTLETRVTLVLLDIQV